MGVCGSEMNDSWPLEALKAQAVCIYTFLLRARAQSESREYKYIKCTTARNIRHLRYDVYTFDKNNKLIDIIEVNETIDNGEYTNSVLLPPETSYVRFVLRKADSFYASKEIIAVYPLWRYIVCGVVVAMATALESAVMYLISRNIIVDALRLRMELSTPIRMTIFTAVISLIVAGLTILAYRRNCKKVINK